MNIVDSIVQTSKLVDVIMILPSCKNTIKACKFTKEIVKKKIGAEYVVRNLDV